MQEVFFALIVAVVLPLRAWRRGRRGAGPATTSCYVAETLVLIAALAALLWRNGVSPEALGLRPSWIRLAADTALCLAAVVGPDAWSAWRISRNSRQAAALPAPAGLAADALAGGRALPQYVAVALTGAIWEELCFRGAVFVLVPPTTGSVVAGIAAGSLVFGAQHLRGGVMSMAYASVFGLLFSILYLLTGDLIAVIVSHCAGNLLTAALWAPWIERSRQAAVHRQTAMFLG